jgi:structure-specific endonuclease subunit SLX1
MIPRGGHCKICKTYILWGDVVRAMYRRSAGGALVELEGDDDALFLSDTESGEPILPPKSAKARGKAKATIRERPVLQEQESSEGEAFDFNVGSSTDSDLATRRKRGRPRKVSPAPVAVVSPKPSPRKRAKPTLQEESSEGEAFDFNVGSSTDSDVPSPRKRGRPRKASPVDAPGPSPRKRAKAREVLEDLPESPKRGPKPAALATKRGKHGSPKPSPKKYHTMAHINAADSSDFFESDSLGELELPPFDHPASNLGPSRLQLVDFLDDAKERVLSRAMSVLSVADVIILSDSE